MQTMGRTAVIGCGRWGLNLVRVLAKLEALGAVADPSPEARARARRIAGPIAVHKDLQEVLDDPSIAAVVIATPAETHYALARAALDAGKDVFVEKPMTVDVEEARDLIERAHAGRRILMVGHLLEYHPAILRLLELVGSGELGDIRYLISNRLNLGKIRTEENALWSFAPHDIAVVLRLVGAMPCEVVATGGCYLQPDIADVTVTQLLFASGARSHIFVSWLHPFKEQKLVVIGSRRMATFDDVQKKLALIDLRINWEAGQPVPVRAPAVDVAYLPDEPLELECAHFLECVKTRAEPRTSGESGLQVLRILKAAQESLSANGRPVPFPLDRAPVGSRSEPPVPQITTTQPDAPIADAAFGSD